MRVTDESRRCWAVSDLDSVRYVDEGGQWSGLTTLVMVEGERRVGGKTTVESRYYISSLPNDASKLLDAVRSHWGIENKLHWSAGRDVQRGRKPGAQR